MSPAAGDRIKSAPRASGDRRPAQRPSRARLLNARAGSGPTPIPTGIERLDILLEGGIPDQASALLRGPRFTGRRALARTTAMAAMEAGIPVIFIHTSGDGDALRARLALHGDVGGLEEAGLLHTVDTSSRLLGADRAPEHTTLVDSPVDLNGIMAAVNKAQANVQEDHDRHLLVIDSLSTLIAHGQMQPTFRFLQVLLGRTQAAGGTTITLLDDGMHDDASVATIHHLMDGLIETRVGEAKQQIRTRGFGLEHRLGWIDCHVKDGRFELTGSFAAGRIR